MKFMSIAPEFVFAKFVSSSRRLNCFTTNRSGALHLTYVFPNNLNHTVQPGLVKIRGRQYELDRRSHKPTLLIEIAVGEAATELAKGFLCFFPQQNRPVADFVRFRCKRSVHCFVPVKISISMSALRRSWLVIGPEPGGRSQHGA
ncbi:hypothetical protein [Hyphomicrobium sp.]|uniref:hypothetical protein n=1 Tax=Hyphomicrobium sp. TaxID=82 RepID=UPI002C1BFF19|nr:hypothetical protein [Hyphomicrobium sp.]HRQ28203.1 hypothetical protein [Hyphomicrobium sp.]